MPATITYIADVSAMTPIFSVESADFSSITTDITVSARFSVIGREYIPAERMYFCRRYFHHKTQFFCWIIRIFLYHKFTTDITVSQRRFSVIGKESNRTDVFFISGQRSFLEISGQFTGKFFYDVFPTCGATRAPSFRPTPFLSRRFRPILLG